MTKSVSEILAELQAEKDTLKKVDEAKVTVPEIGISADDKAKETENAEIAANAALNKKIKDSGTKGDPKETLSFNPKPDNNGSDQSATDAENDKIKNSGNKGDKDMKKPNTMKEDIDTLFDGETLTEEFKNKAIVIFETAVNNKIKKEVSSLQEKYEQKFDKEVDNLRNQLVEHIDLHLDELAAQWLEENKTSVENTLRTQLAEEFMAGLKQVFEQNYIEVPEDKINIIDEMEQRINSLEEQYNSNLDRTIELVKENASLKRNTIVKDLSGGLTVADSEKFKTLVEDLKFESEDNFIEKAKTIKETYFKDKTTIVESKSEDVHIENQTVDAVVDLYAKALSNKN